MVETPVSFKACRETLEFDSFASSRLAPYSLVWQCASLVFKVRTAGLSFAQNRPKRTPPTHPNPPKPKLPLTPTRMSQKNSSGSCLATCTVRGQGERTQAEPLPQMRRRTGTRKPVRVLISRPQQCSGPRYHHPSVLRTPSFGGSAKELKHDLRGLQALGVLRKAALL